METSEIIAAAQRRLLAEPAVGAAELPAHVRHQPGLIRLPSLAGDRVPTFQLDRGGRPHEVVLQVNRILRADRDPWAAADWWLGGNTWLRATPASLLGRRNDLIVAAAEALMSPDW